MTDPLPGDTGETGAASLLEKGVASLAALPFEAAMSELEAIVRRLEEGRVELEESIAIFERGETLKRHCEALLRNAEARIEKIALGPNGAPKGVVPLDSGT